MDLPSWAAFELFWKQLFLIGREVDWGHTKRVNEFRQKGIIAKT
jgi:hypothetical protein